MGGWGDKTVAFWAWVWVWMYGRAVRQNSRILGVVWVWVWVWVWVYGRANNKTCFVKMQLRVRGT